MTKQEIQESNKILQSYISGKAALNNRVIENEKWFKLRHWDTVENGAGDRPVSAWLFNSLANKHADAMDNFPEPKILPRDENDTQVAQILSKTLPMILENNDYEQSYSDLWWQKLKCGTSITGVFWDQTLLNGLGDIKICPVDILSLYWEPGVKDIQDSEHVFYLRLLKKKDVLTAYDLYEWELSNAGNFLPAQYESAGNATDSDSVLVIDRYTRVLNDRGLYSLKFVKYVGDICLYDSDNDTNLSARGFYNHGMYPFVFDTMFKTADSACGFGLIDICKSPQTYIDRLQDAILKTSLMAAKPRFFIKGGAGVNEEEYSDWNNDFVHLHGASDPNDAISEIKISPIDGNTLSVLNHKINEIKEVSGNRDFSSGGTMQGVTAYSAIAALQEAGSKLSRDMIKSSYRSFRRVCGMMISLIRQFYTLPRSMRITNDDGKLVYLSLDNTIFRDDSLNIFDVSVKAQKQSAYSTIAQNELAKEFFNAGFFNTARADEALLCLEMMDFEGKDRVKNALAALRGRQIN